MEITNNNPWAAQVGQPAPTLVSELLSTGASLTLINMTFTSGLTFVLMVSTNTILLNLESSVTSAVELVRTLIMMLHLNHHSIFFVELIL